MVDLHETDNAECRPQIDTGGWLSPFAVAITTATAMVAYEANNTMVANSSVSHIVAG
jgi:hypothetical protein